MLNNEDQLPNDATVQRMLYWLRNDTEKKNVLTQKSDYPVISEKISDEQNRQGLWSLHTEKCK